MRCIRCGGTCREGEGWTENDISLCFAGKPPNHGKRLRENELSEKLLPILRYLEIHVGITPHEAEQVTGKSAATARRYFKMLEMLAERGMLLVEGKTNKRSFPTRPKPRGEAPCYEEEREVKRLK
jgi:hypothetical protein